RWRRRLSHARPAPGDGDVNRTRSGVAATRARVPSVSIVRRAAESGEPDGASTPEAVENRLRALPSVEQLAAAVDGAPKHLLVMAAREKVTSLRERILAGIETS